MYTLGHKYEILTYPESKIQLCRLACKYYEPECLKLLHVFSKSHYFTSSYKSLPI